MKKSIYLISLALIASLFSAPSFADDDEWEHHHRRHGYGHHGWGHHHGHHNHYYPAPEVHYVYPQPQVNYYVPPPVAYYPAPPAYQRYDRRNPTGLAGGVVGSVFGYELGGGDPIATGLGAAAGSFLGNGMYGGGY